MSTASCLAIFTILATQCLGYNIQSSAKSLTHAQAPSAQADAGIVGNPTRFQPLGKPHPGIETRVFVEFSFDEAKKMFTDWQLQQILESAEQVEEQLWEILDMIMGQVLDDATQAPVSHHARSLHAAPSPLKKTATMDSVLAKMNQLAQKLLRLELSDSIHSAFQIFKESLGIPINASNQAAAIAADTTGAAAATVLLDAVQNAMQPAGSQRFASGTNPTTDALASATQTFATTLKKVEMLAASARAASNASHAPPKERAAAVAAAVKPLLASMLRGVTATAPKSLVRSSGIHPGRLKLTPDATSRTQGLLSGAPGLQSNSAALEKQMAGVMDVINQHSVDFSKLFSNLTITFPSLDLDETAGSQSQGDVAATAAADAYINGNEHRRLLEQSAKSELGERYRELKERWYSVAKPVLSSARRTLRSLPSGQRGGLLQAESSIATDSSTSELTTVAASGPAPPPIPGGPHFAPAETEQNGGEGMDEVLEIVIIQNAAALASGQDLLDSLLALLLDAINFSMSPAAQDNPYSSINVSSDVMYFQNTDVMGPTMGRSDSGPRANTGWPEQPAPPTTKAAWGRFNSDNGSEEGWRQLVPEDQWENYGMLGRRLRSNEVYLENSDDAYDATYQYGDEYNEEAWLDSYAWLVEDSIQNDPEHTGPSTHSEDDDMLPQLVLDLLVGSGSPAGLSDELVVWLNQIAALLRETADAAEAGSLGDGAPGNTVTALPHFAVFGPKQGHTTTNFSSNGTATSADVGGGSSGLFAAVVVPLSGTARAPANIAGSTPIGSFDAKWWGMAGSLAFLCMLLGALAVAVVRRSSPSQHEDSFNNIPGVPSVAANQEQSPASITPLEWEQAVQQKTARQSLVQGAVAKKLSNLPA